MNKDFLLKRLKPFENNKVLVTNYQNTKDIISQLLNAQKVYSSQYDKISEYFWKGNLKDTCRYIYNFLKENVKYSIEPDERQSVKSPSAIISTGIYVSGLNDCKHYSQFSLGILSSLQRKGFIKKDVDLMYRFANYKLFSNQPHHVFCVVRKNDKEIWLDAVINKFDYKKFYVNKIDKIIK
jgi:hypothetical protein